MSLCCICYHYNGKHTHIHTNIPSLLKIATGKGISLLLVWNFWGCKPFFHLKQLFLLWNFLIMRSFLVLYHIIAKADCAFLDKIYLSIKLRNRFLLESWLN